MLGHETSISTKQIVLDIFLLDFIHSDVVDVIQLQFT